MPGISFPDVGIFVSGCDPNDPNGGDLLWSSNLATRTWRINQAGRGRQYEQDQNRTGAADLDLRNVDEWLNPANASSPLLTFVHPMRRIRMMASYPPAGTGNTINTTAGLDPTFDSYTTGTLPAWLVPVGSAPTVQAANPHSGANSVQYAVTNAISDLQGVSTVPLSCFPGKQYTASWWVRQSSASTLQLTVGGLTAMDRFQRTGAWSSSNGDTGQTWSFSGGVTGDYTTTAGVVPPGFGSASISNGSVNVPRLVTIPLAARDSDQRVLVTLPAVATGGFYYVSLVSRFVDANNYYFTGIQANTDGTLSAGFGKRVSGTNSFNYSPAGLNYTAGTQVWVRTTTVGPAMQVKVWLAGTVEPSTWTSSTTDTSIITPGGVGLHCLLSAGTTNPTPVVAFARFAVTSYSIASATTTTTGAYVRLTATFTATQPAHIVAVTTIGTTVGGTVNLDDVQLEPGGTANTFTTSGPLIRGLWGGHVTEFPVTWEPGSQGFEGSVNGQCSGAFAALTQIPMHTDYITAVLRKSPDYYWPLWDQQGASTFAEISGHAGSPLQRTDGIAGPGPTFSAATTMAIPGDPGAVGLAIDQPATGYLNLPTTIAATDLAALRQPVSIGSATNTFGLTVSAWITHTAIPATSASRTFLLISSPALPATYQMSWHVDGVDPTKLDFGSSAAAVQVTDAWGDGKPHLYVTTLSAVGGNITCTLWVDGVQAATFTPGWVSVPVGTVAEIGGSINPAPDSTGYHTTTAGLNGGVYSHFAVWNRTLSNAEITDLWTAGGLGNGGESSGARVSRYLRNYYVGPSLVDANTLSVMGTATAPESTSLLSALQRVQDTEAGNLFENRDGAVQFDGRGVRYLRITPSLILGDGPGEVPYTEAPVYGFGLTQVNNQALVTRSGGTRAVALPDNTGSLATNYARGFTLTVDCQTDNEAFDHANWVVATRQQPLQRVAKVRLDLGANPSAFPAAMNLEIGSRITQKRRPKAANAGAGITMSSDFFVENISHASIDPEAGTWFVDLELSPIPPQVWILNDTTYSVLGVTTRLGF